MGNQNNIITHKKDCDVIKKTKPKSTRVTAINEVLITVIFTKQQKETAILILKNQHVSENNSQDHVT